MRHISPPKKSIWSIVLFSFLFFLIAAAVVEEVARTPWFERNLPYRSVGNHNYQFEIKWFRLQDYVEQNGGVDIIILGSSLVNTGLDPDIVSQTFYEQTGTRPRIFNFGVEGLTIAPNSVLAGLLVERYHPALLIYVTEMRDYIAGNGLEYETPFLNDPWFRYQLGDFTLFGWLADHSAALQHYLPFRNWMQANFLETAPIYLRRYADTTASGYEPDRATASDLDATPDPKDPHEAPYFEEYGNYQIAPSRLEDLNTILKLKRDGETAVWVVEMPVHASFYVYVGGEAVHREFQQTIASLIVSKGSLFIPAETCNAIPLEGRSNRWHLNYIGAPYFSHCLGGQLAIYAGQHGTAFLTGDNSR